MDCRGVLSLLIACVLVLQTTAHPLSHTDSLMLHPGRLKEYLLFQHGAFMRLRINEKHRRNLELIYWRTGSAGNRRGYRDDLDPLSPVFHMDPLCAVYRHSHGGHVFRKQLEKKNISCTDLVRSTNKRTKSKEKKNKIKNKKWNTKGKKNL